MRLFIKSVLEDESLERDVSRFILSKPPFSTDEELKNIVLQRRLSSKRTLGEKPDLQPGQVVRTANYKVKILSCGGKGNTGAVYKVETKSGKVIALKVCVKYGPEQIISMQREAKKMEFLKELKVIPHTAILEAGDDYVLKEWAEGITGAQWFQDWFVTGCDLEDQGFKELIKLFQDIAKMNIYLQNFKPQNLVWDAVKWCVVDYGGHKTGVKEEEVMDKYADKFDRLWNKKKELVPPLKELLKRSREGRSGPVLVNGARKDAEEKPKGKKRKSRVKTQNPPADTRTNGEEEKKEGVQNEKEKAGKKAKPTKGSPRK